MTQQQFDIPVVLFAFRRHTGFERIIPVIRKVKPKKVYILSDYGRNDDEVAEVIFTRNLIEQMIDWECEIVRRYATENIGVLNNIGEGARWVLQQEDRAIFLEDDNLPAESFFQYCQELLEKYCDDSRILWICGTNYDQESSFGEEDYFYTQHLIPCGWASWSGKFLKHYDINLEKLGSPGIKNKISKTYKDKALFRQQYLLFEKTKYLIETNKKASSWDYQMLFSMRSADLYGIAPRLNQITNIGVDSLSTHGGVSFDLEMTRRFCGIPTKELEFPLRGSDTFYVNEDFDRHIGNIIKYPLRDRIKIQAASIIKPLIGIDKHASFKRTMAARKEGKDV